MSALDLALSLEQKHALAREAYPDHVAFLEDWKRAWPEGSGRFSPKPRPDPKAVPMSVYGDKVDIIMISGKWYLGMEKGKK